MIAVDTNILVYAHRADADWHSAAVNLVTELAEGTSEWSIPWSCLHEFIAVVTHPRIFKTPTPLKQAFGQVDAWLESPTLVVLSENDQHADMLRRLAVAGRIRGPQVHDARIAAVCLSHGVREIWTADRDFSKFAPLKAKNPLNRS